MKSANVLLGTLLAVAALAAAAPVHAQRYAHERYEEARYARGDERQLDERYGDRNVDGRFDDERFDDERYVDERYDDRNVDERFDDERYVDERYDGRYDDEDGDGYDGRRDDEPDDFVYARVIDIDPIIDIATRPVEKQQCTRAPAARRPPAATEGILASVLAEPGPDGNTPATPGPRRCTTRTEYVREERITGYDVAYVYRGRSYTTVTSRPPGERIRIAVAQRGNR